MSIDEYYQWFKALGFAPTGECTLTAEEWSNKEGTFIWITRPQELTPEDRAEAIERYKMYLGIDYPPGGGGVH